MYEELELYQKQESPCLYERLSGLFLSEAGNTYQGTRTLYQRANPCLGVEPDRRLSCVWK